MANERTSWDAGRMFARMTRRDAEAYEVWQRVVAWTDPPALPAGWPHATTTGPMAGRVTQCQTYARGSKAFVHFGRHLDTQDTWWPRTVGVPAPGSYVVVSAHLWAPPGTHSGRDVLWIDEWHWAVPARTVRRADRYARRLSRRQGAAPRPWSTTNVMT